MKKILLTALSAFSFSYGAYSQSSCDSAKVYGLTLQCAGGTSNRTAVAYNPLMQLYYSADAGNGTYPLETFDYQGNKDTSATSGADYRGLWWNDNIDSIEGNTYNGGGIYAQILNPANGYAKGAKISALWASTMPFSQSSGAFDADSNEIVYQYSGQIYRYDRVTNTLKYTTAITGVSTSNLNTEFIGYTGIVGEEYLVYDYSAQAVYFINRDGVYVKKSLLPSSAVSNSGFKASYANNLFWLFNATTLKWTSYVLNAAFATVATNVDTLTASISNATSYQWFDCTAKATISGATSQKYTPLVSGSYAVIVSISGCTDTSACTSFTYVAPITGISSASQVSSFSVYPNPNQGTFTISSTYSNAHVTIYNSQGATVQDADLNGQQTTIGLGTVTPGIYYLVTDSDQGKTTQKIVVE